jgi:Ca2+-binding EF-hand superfamily protein
VYPHGYVVKDEFKKLYSQLYPHKELDKQFIDLIFAAFDTDKSGFVTFTEFLIAVSLSSSKDPRKKLHLAFKMYDRNRSGSLDKSEIDSILTGLREIAAKKGLNTAEIETSDIMNWDKDGNGSLNEEEFVNYIMSNETLKKYYLDLIKTYDA